MWWYYKLGKLCCSVKPWRNSAWHWQLRRSTRRIFPRSERVTYNCLVALVESPTQQYRTAINDALYSIEIVGTSDASEISQSKDSHGMRLGEPVKNVHGNLYVKNDASISSLGSRLLECSNPQCSRSDYIHT